MKRLFPKFSGLLLVLMALAVILRPVAVFAGLQSTVHPSLLGNKKHLPTCDAPVQPSVVYSRVNKMEKDSVPAAFLKSGTVRFSCQRNQDFSSNVFAAKGFSARCPVVLRI
ncbi:MAG: hypothetical protein ACREL1_06555 [bacterium]